jgi:hypothetical protein
MATGWAELDGKGRTRAGGGGRGAPRLAKQWEGASAREAVEGRTGWRSGGKAHRFAKRCRGAPVGEGAVAQDDRRRERLPPLVPRRRWRRRQHRRRAAAPITRGGDGPWAGPAGVRACVRARVGACAARQGRAWWDSIAAARGERVRRIPPHRTARTSVCCSSKNLLFTRENLAAVLVPRPPWTGRRGCMTCLCCSLEDSGTC